MPEHAPRLLRPATPAVGEVLDLVRRSFAYMDSRIDPPSSMHRLTEDAIAEHCSKGEVWTLGDPVQACIFLSVKSDALYIGKLAVEAAMRGRGLARALVNFAEDRATLKGLPALELETRVELTENHAAFARLGFAKVREAAHAGYDRPTFIVMRKQV